MFMTAGLHDSCGNVVWQLEMRSENGKAIRQKMIKCPGVRIDVEFCPSQLAHEPFSVCMVYACKKSEIPYSIGIGGNSTDEQTAFGILIDNFACVCLCAHNQNVHLKRDWNARE